VDQATNTEFIDAAAGEPFVVVLADDGIGGYLWRIAEQPPAITVLREETLPPLEAAPGAGGSKLFELQATEPGTHTVRFELRRDWEPGAAREHIAVVTAR
jgi:predicted secreted protein